MSYRCTVCREIVPPGTPRMVHTIHRQVPRLPTGTRSEIATEVPVCSQCQADLSNSVHLDDLMDKHANGTLELDRILRRPVLPPIDVSEPLILEAPTTIEMDPLILYDMPAKPKRSRAEPKTTTNHKRTKKESK